MFLTEVVAGTLAGSVALQADALDFLADAANYGISLCVLGMALVWRARAALVKGISMGVLGLLVATSVLQHAMASTVPAAPVMGALGVLALLANVATALIPYRQTGRASCRERWCKSV